MTSDDMKALIARYLRYDLQCPVLGLEIASSLATSYNDGGSADVLAVNKKRYLIEVEVKTSLADMKADRRKLKHEYYRKCIGMPYKNTAMRFGKGEPKEPKAYPTHLFYFAVPYELANEAVTLCENLYPYAGLLTNKQHFYGNIVIEKQPQILNRERLSLLQMARIAKGQSATLVRLLEVVCHYQHLNNHLK